MVLFWWSLFIVSCSLLIFTLLRRKYAIQWLAVVGMNIVVAALLLYFINWLGVSSNFHIAINWGTIGAIAILGIPGLLLLIALKMTLFI